MGNICDAVRDSVAFTEIRSNFDSDSTIAQGNQLVSMAVGKAGDPLSNKVAAIMVP